MVRHRNIAAVVAIAVALTPSLEPIASADPAPLAQAEAAIAAKQNRAPVRPNPDNQTEPRAASQQGPCSEVCSGGTAAQGQTSVAPHLSIAARLHAGTSTATPPIAAPPQSVVRVATAHDGFHWGDAGIGAGAVLVLLAIGLAGTLVATHGRRSRTRADRAVATS